MQDLLGDLIPKGEKIWIKVRHVPNKEGEMFPRRKNIPKGETCQVDQVNT